MPSAEHLAHLRGLEGHLRAHLRGQDHVLARAAAVFVRGELGLTRRDGPKGTFLAVGPTGTGKTELVLLSARYLFGEGSVCRFDLSEYQRDDAVERLLGGSGNEGGAIGRAAQQRSPRIWLFDEMEKAHSKVFDLFLQILEPGRTTLSNGEVISFVDDYVCFTSNLGSAEAMRMARSSPASVEQAILRRVGEALRPEILARVSEKLVFARLSPEIQREIAELHLASELARLKEGHFDLEVSREVVEYLVREGFHPNLGARPLRQTIDRNIQDAVVRSLLACGVASGRIEVAASLNRLELRVR